MTTKLTSLDKMHNLRERVAKLQPRVEAWQEAIGKWEAEQDGLAWLLLKAAWPALRVIAALERTEWMADPVECRPYTTVWWYLCDEPEPAFRVEEEDRRPYFIRGERDVSAFLSDMGSVQDIASEIDEHLARWECETEPEDHVVDWYLETAAMRELRAALVTFERASSSVSVVAEAAS